MYLRPNFKTKKDAKAAIARGDTVSVFQPGLALSKPATNGTEAVEGPHFPAPHTWYGKATIQNGKVVKLT